MWMHATCFLDFNIPVATPFLFMLRPRSGYQQWVGREQYVLTPSVPAVEFTDPFGNLCQRLVAGPGRFSVHTSVDIESAEFSDVCSRGSLFLVQELPDETIPFLLPSRFCESDRFIELAPSSSTGGAPGYDQCTAIVDYIRRTTQYAPGAGQQIISACEVNERSQAVCRDWHIWEWLVVARCPFRRGWSWVISRICNRWICMPGSKPMSEDVGTRLIQPKQAFKVAGWRSPMVGMRQMSPSSRSSGTRWNYFAWMSRSNECPHLPSERPRSR